MGGCECESDRGRKSEGVCRSSCMSSTSPWGKPELTMLTGLNRGETVRHRDCAWVQCHNRREMCAPREKWKKDKQGKEKIVVDWGGGRAVARCLMLRNGYGPLGELRRTRVMGSLVSVALEGND